MQTFLPYDDFTATARALDQRRLGKQRVETIQILRALTWPKYGWRHHPAVKMWAGYEEALVRYGLDICAVWCEIGRSDTCADTLVADFTAACGGGLLRREDEPAGPVAIRRQDALARAGDLPPWLGDQSFHLPHRAALIRKDPDFYRPVFGDDVPEDLEYLWPPSDRPPGCRRAE